MPRGVEDAYCTAISRKPDRQIYINPDLIDVDDPEFHQHDLYPYYGSVNTWFSSAIDRIKFLWPSQPPLLNWDQMNKVSHIYFKNYSKFLGHVFNVLKFYTFCSQINATIEK